METFRSRRTDRGRNGCRVCESSSTTVGWTFAYISPVGSLITILTVSSEGKIMSTMTSAAGILPSSIFAPCARICRTVVMLGACEACCQLVWGGGGGGGGGGGA